MVALESHDLRCGCGACAEAFREGASADPAGGGIAANGKTILTAEQAGENLTRKGYSWRFDNYGVLDDGVLNFAFWSSYDELASSYYVNADGTVALEEVELADKFSVFGATQVAVAEKSLALWDDLVAIRFARADAGAGDIMFGNTQSAPGSGAYAYQPFGSGQDAFYKERYGFAEIGRVGGDVWINAFVGGNNGTGANGTYMLHTMVHEIGHALGLSHTGDYNASQDRDGDGRPDPITYATHATAFQDTQQYSVMSYFTADKSGASHLNWRTLGFVLPSTPMVHDVLAVQKLYGADAGTRTGDTVYGFNSSADRDAFDFSKTELPVATIWDAGGDDTLDFSGWTSNSTIDLNPGAFSSGGGTGFLPLAELKARGVVPAGYTEEQYAALKAKYNSTDGLLKDNVAIAYGTVIENAVGGAGNDRIVGNEVANRLFGGAGDDALSGGGGDDRIEGGAGADKLDGGAGKDALIGGLGDDVYVVDDAGDLVVEAAGEGVDEVRTSLADYALPDGADRLVYTGAGGARLRGNAGDNVVVGGDAGDVFLLQGGGDDSAVGGAGDDGFYFGAAMTRADRVDGGAGSNDQAALQGVYAALTLGAGSLDGVETLVLLPGSDTRFGDASGSTNGYAIVTESGLLAAGARLLVTMNTLRAGENVVFDGSAETAGGFLFFGGAGNDALTGGANGDAFYFGTARFGAGDRLAGGAGDDQLGLQGDYAGAAAVVFGADQLAGIESIVLLSGADTRFGARAGGSHSYDLTLADGNAAAGSVLTVNGNTLRVGETLRADASAEADASVRIFGGAGADALTGGAGADTIFGGAGDDRIDGGAGADLVVGGAGIDRLRGGAGADVFRFDAVADSSVDAGDILFDFERGVDRIDLSRIDADANADGDQAFAFVGEAAFSGRAGELRIALAGSATPVVQADVDGDGRADLRIMFDTAGGQVPTAGDFTF